MKNSLKIIEKVRAKTDTKTDYAVAKALGLDQSTLILIKKGARSLGNEACFRAAAILNLPVAEVIAFTEVDKARSEEKRAWWMQQSPRLAPSVAIVAATLLSAGGSLTDGVQGSLDHQSTYYVQ